MLDIAGKQVPLPPGAWEVAATGVQPAGAAEAPFGVVRSAILLLRDGEQVRALLEVNANDIAVGGGWAAPCGNDPLPPQLRLRYRSRYDASCAGAGATRLDAPARRSGRRRAPASSGPGCACRRHADRHGAVRRPAGFPGGAHTPARRARGGRCAPAEGAAGLGTLYASLLEQGLSRRLDGLVLDWPGRAALLQDSPVLDRRLLRIEAMRRAGVITPPRRGCRKRPCSRRRR